jgi:signal transduction histidine kinase
MHVMDSGIGLDPELLRASNGQPGHELVFDAFRRGANVVAAGIPGTGLGLSIVREVVEQAGGRIWVVSRPGAGTSFSLTLPAREPSGEEPVVRDTRSTQVVMEKADARSAEPEPPPQPGAPRGQRD